MFKKSLLCILGLAITLSIGCTGIQPTDKSKKSFEPTVKIIYPEGVPNVDSPKATINTTVLKGKILLPAGILLSAGMTAKAESTGKGFEVTAFDKDGKTYGRVNADR